MRIHGAAALVLVAACGAPTPRSAQEILRDSNVPYPVLVERKGTQLGEVTTGDSSTFGDVAVLVESSVHETRHVDLVEPTVRDALLVQRVPPPSPEKLAATERLAALIVDVGRAKGGNDAASADADAKEIAGYLGRVMMPDQDDTLFRIGAIVRGIPHRATCSVRYRGLHERRAALLCVIVRADERPKMLWRLALNTEPAPISSTEGIVSPTRGYLYVEPGTQGPKFHFARPDPSTPWFRRSEADYVSFGVQQDATAVARLCTSGRIESAGRVMDGGVERCDRVWRAETRGLDESSGAALDVALGILTLVPWPGMQVAR